MIPAAPQRTPLSVALRIARRELRGGLKGFRVFLACLAMGVAAIAAVGSVRVSIEQGLAREGASILGGDAELSFTYRFADDTERAFMEEIADVVSETVDFRSMVVVPREEVERGLTQVRGVDAGWPIYGSAGVEPPLPVAEALAMQDGVPGAVMAQLLVDRLALEVGDIFRLGTQDFELRAVLVDEPDGASSGFGLGPRTVVSLDGLETSGLLEPGTLFESQYRLRLPEDSDLDALKARAEAFEDTGARWRDARNGAPGVARFIDRIGAFLVLVGLAGLAVGGVGVSSAVRAYLEGKIATIATLKTVGAEGGTIFAAYFAQIGVLTAVGIAIGLILGAGAPVLFGPLIEARLPVPVAISVYPAPLAEAALYGALTALIFTLWPLAQTRHVRAAGLFRGAAGGLRGLPEIPYLLVIFLLVLALAGVAVWFSGVPVLALGTAGGLLLALALLAGAAWGIRALCRAVSQMRALRGRTALRTALGAVGGPGSEAGSVVLSLGLGLAVLASVGQIETNLRTAIQTNLPEVAPSYFFVDIQPDQIAGFLDRVESDLSVSRVDSAPSLRGVITQINGARAQDVAGDHWVIRGDRGVTYMAGPPPPEEITTGEWWAADYDGPPLVAFAAEEAGEIGIGVGDTITVNILGRDITATIAALREVSFENAGIGFILTMNEAALAGAPHTFIATVYAEPEAEAQILRDVANDAPNVTAIRVRDALDQVAEALRGIATATSYAALATLLTGFIVLIGAAAAGERGRVFEAAVLKTLGATRTTILASFAIRAALLGASAGAVAIATGALGGWAVMTFVMDADYVFEPISAIAIVAGGALTTLLAGLAFAWRPLAARPAGVLRARD